MLGVDPHTVAKGRRRSDERLALDPENAICYISSTATRTGLKVKAVLNSKIYETGETVTDEEIQMLRIRLHNTHPEWNYTIKPQI